MTAHSARRIIDDAGPAVPSRPHRDDAASLPCNGRAREISGDAYRCLVARMLTQGGGSWSDNGPLRSTGSMACISLMSVAQCSTTAVPPQHLLKALQPVSRRCELRPAWARAHTRDRRASEPRQAVRERRDTACRVGSPAGRIDRTNTLCDARRNALSRGAWMQVPSRDEGFTVRRDCVLHATSLLYAGQILALVKK